MGGEIIMAYATNNRRRIRKLQEMDLLRITICCLILCIFLVLYTIFLVFATIFSWGFHSNCSLNHFYMPALDKTLNSPNDTTLFFTIKLENGDYNRQYYDPINVTFFEGPNRRHSIANFTFGNFEQKEGNTLLKGGVLETSGFDREAAARAIQAQGSAVFRVDLATKVNYNIWFWKGMMKHNMKVGTNVQVNDRGAKVNSGDIYLKSYASKNKVVGFNCRKLGVLWVSFLVLACSW